MTEAQKTYVCSIVRVFKWKYLDTMKTIFKLGLSVVLAFWLSGASAAQIDQRTPFFANPTQTASEPLRIVLMPKAEFTAEARKNKLQGTVRLAVTFLASGKIGNIEIVTGLPDGLSDMARVAAKNILFEPEKKQNEPITVTRQLEYLFKNDWGQPVGNNTPVSQTRSSSVVSEQPQLLKPVQPVTFSLTPGNGKVFALRLTENDIVDVSWLVSDELILHSGILDPSGKPLAIGGDDDALLFTAPSSGEYTLVLKYDEGSEVKDRQNITVQYAVGFTLPNGSKQKALRRINGYDIRIYTTPEVGDESGLSIVVFEKDGLKKKILRSFGQGSVGYSFADDVFVSAFKSAKEASALIRNTLDKTGDGIPDVMIDYYSGGSHCCFTTFFFNLGRTVDLIEELDTQHAGLVAKSLNPAGGLRFETSENNFAYWNACFACSPMPRVILEFNNGVLRPNFELMKKPPPTLSAIKNLARTARLKISLEPYTDDGEQFEEAFWAEMLNLIYTGNEGLAWQYFDLVWPSGKQGKELFATNFKEVLSSGYYGSPDAAAQNGFRNYWKGFYKILDSLRNNVN